MDLEVHVVKSSFEPTPSYKCRMSFAASLFLRMKLCVHCCRYMEIETPTTIMTNQSTTGTVPPDRSLVTADQQQVCSEGFCYNGGTCHQIQLPDRVVPSCDCPLHFTGRFCEKGGQELFYPKRVSTSTSHLNSFWQLLLFLGGCLGILTWHESETLD